MVYRKKELECGIVYFLKKDGEYKIKCIYIGTYPEPPFKKVVLFREGNLPKILKFNTYSLDELLKLSAGEWSVFYLKNKEAKYADELLKKYGL